MACGVLQLVLLQCPNRESFVFENTGIFETDSKGEDRVDMAQHLNSRVKSSRLIARKYKTDY